MSTLSNLNLRRALADPALRESLLATSLVFVATAGLNLVVTWLWVVREALRSARPETVGRLVVCGHVLEDGRPSQVFVERLQRAARVAAERPGLGIMIAGGGRPSEAVVGRDWLVDRAGLDPARIELEEVSTDTFENLRHARSLLPEGVRLGMVTSRFHLARVMIYARQLGLEATPVPAEPRFSPTPANLSATLREAGFLTWFLCGRFWARLARRGRLLERIR